MTQKKVFVALSGGVDSSVAAALLKERGSDVYGVHIKMWSPADLGTVCEKQLQDRYDAMRVAAVLDIPFQTWDFTEEYRRAVVEYMVREYAASRTPNPDVMCNSRIKFGKFLQQALALGADYIATGHYVRLRNTKKYEITKPISYIRKNFVFRSPESLLQAKDGNKDQSYFLWTLTHGQLHHCLFPIGEYAKPEVRELARKFGLPTAEKPDSQGICFIGEIDVREFLRNYIPEQPGRVLTTAGKVVGEHNGVEFYTIGQRHGLGIGGRPAPLGEPRPFGAGGIPYYVAGKDIITNTLVVAEGPYDERLFRKELMATDVNWISGEEPEFPLRCEARIRYRQPLQPCIVQVIENGKIDEVVKRGKRSDSPSGAIHRVKRSTNLIVTFDEPQRAVTPGQSVVFYARKSFGRAQDLEMLGGAIIA